MANLIYRGPNTPVSGNPSTLTKGTALTVDEMNQNLFGLNEDIQTRALIAGGNIFTGGDQQVQGTGLVILKTVGDVVAYRAAGTTGYLYLNSALTKGLGNDGTAYQLPLQGLVVGGNVQAPGLSTTWGTTGGTGTGAINAVMGITTNATWLLSGTSGGVFRAGIQALDSDGTLRIWSGAQGYEFDPTGLLTLPGSAYIPRLHLVAGTANSGIVEFHSAGAVRQGYIGDSATAATLDAGTLPYVAGLHQFTGNVDVSGSLTVSADTVIDNTVTTTTVTTATTIATVPLATYRSVDFNIQAVDATAGLYHSAKVLAIHNGTLADWTEYGAVAVGGATGTFTVTIVGTDMVLQVTPASTNSTTFKVTTTMTKV